MSWLSLPKEGEYGQQTQTENLYFLERMPAKEEPVSVEIIEPNKQLDLKLTPIISAA